MNIAAYDIYKFIYHLEACPHQFLKPSIYEKGSEKDGIDTNALVLDVLRDIDPSLFNTVRLVEEEGYKRLNASYLGAIHIACWFFSMDVFHDRQALINPIKRFISNDLKTLSQYVGAEAWISDEERTEEFVRIALMACNIVPKNETEEESLDKLDSISTLKRNNVLSESKAAYERIIEIRKKMAEKKAREAANVYGRE